MPASGSTSLPLSDRARTWDAGAAKKRLSPSQYGQAFFWRDPDGDPETLVAYKLGFVDVVGGRLVAVWRGVTAVAAVLQGGRGGVDIPAGDVAGVRRRVAAYYAKAREQFDDDTIEVPWMMRNSYDEVRVKTVDVAMKAEGRKGVGEFEAVLSAPSIDRDGEIVDAGAFDPLPDHLNIDVDHSLKAADIVASGRPFYDGDLLKIAGTFASTPRAQEIRSLITEGHLRHMSLTYRAPDIVKVDGVPHVRKAELLNATFTTVPANRDAMVLTAKIGARNSAKDAEMIQTMHDNAVALGADCTAKSHRPDNAKSIVTLVEEYCEANPGDPDVVSFREALSSLQTESSTITDPESAAATVEVAAAETLADVQVALALAEHILAEATLAS